jgi:hypothetical protein
MKNKIKNIARLAANIGIRAIICVAVLPVAILWAFETGGGYAKQDEERRGG